MPSLMRFFFGASVPLVAASSLSEAAPHAVAAKKFLRVNFIVAGVRGLVPERPSPDQQKRSPTERPTIHKSLITHHLTARETFRPCSARHCLKRSSGATGNQSAGVINP